MILKKLVSTVMIFTMLMMCVQPCFAATINDKTDFVPNPLEMGLAVGVTARKSGTTDAYTDALSIADIIGGVGVDYQATLNMKPIRDICTGPFITSVIGNDPDLKDEFDEASVTTNVTVEIEYPSAASISGSLATAGVLDAGDIFEEVSPRSITGNKVTITYKNADDITARDLVDNVNTYLKDIKFTLNDTITYSTVDYHTVTVKLSGATSIAFSTKTQEIEYTGEASHIVSASTNHTLQVVPNVPATCFTKGWTEGVKCITHEHMDDGYGCGANGIVEPQQTIDMLDHILIYVDEVDSTCTATGVKEHWVCTLCKTDFSDAQGNDVLDSLTIAKKDHDYEDIPAVSATCTENGMTAGKICRVCKHVDKDNTPKVVPATGHTEQVIPSVAPDCTTPGATEGKKCSACHAVLITTKPVAATGHNFGDWNITVYPTEDAVGSKTRTCLNNCGETETVEIPKLEHVCVIDPSLAVITKTADCTNTGLKQNYCACGLPVGAPETIPAIGHNATRISVFVPATCTVEGVLEHWACANCGGLFTDAQCQNKITSARIPVNLNNHGGSTVELPAVAPTCEKDGLTAGVKCVACKTITVPQNIVSRTGHTFEDIAEEPADCTHKGAHAHKHCTVCKKDFATDGVTEVTPTDYEIAPLGHSFNYTNVITSPLPYKEATDTEEGLGKILCSRCSDHKDVVIAKTLHVHNEECEKIITPATCTSTGLKRIVYTCCGEVKENNIVIPIKPHTPREIAKVESTCYEKGVERHWYCSECNKLFKDAACTQETTIAEITLNELLHNYVFHHENANFIFHKCSICHDMKKIGKNNKVDVKDNGSDKDKKDKVKEERYNEEKEETGRKAIVYTENIPVETEISSELEQAIHQNDTETQKASDEKVVFEIAPVKVTVYVDKDNDKEVHLLLENEILDEERELVSQTDVLKEYTFKVPSTMQGFTDFLVHRLHNGTAQTLTTTPNGDGEYIVISADKSTVTLFAKNFSEYALVGYNAVVNPTQPITSTSGGSLSYTVRFNANGGTTVETIRVKRGGKIELPIPTREGYKFVGWFADYALTVPFDANTAIYKNYVLYAKWVEEGKCEGTVADNCPCLKYNDLNPELWYHEGVDYVLNNGMMIGTGETTFEPDASVTRAMLVTVLWRAEGKPEATEDSTFADLKNGEYYVDAVEWAAKNGIVNGYTETEFAPDDNIAREQIAAIMFRYAAYKGYDVSVGENTNILSYTDYSQISEYAIPAMQWAADSGLMTGRTNSTLNPQADTTRAEIATVLYRFFAAK